MGQLLFSNHLKKMLAIMKIKESSTFLVLDENRNLAKTNTWSEQSG